MKPLSEVEKAYLACAIDTEGTIALYQKRRKMKGMINFHTHFYPRIKIGNTNREFLEFCRKQMELGNISSNGVRWKENGWKPAFVIVIGSWKDIQELLIQILPFLIIKHKHAKLMLEACSLHLPLLGKHKEYPARMFELAKEIAKLNRKGNTIIDVTPTYR